MTDFFIAAPMDAGRHPQSLYTPVLLQDPHYGMPSLYMIQLLPEMKTKTYQEQRQLGCI